MPKKYTADTIIAEVINTARGRKVISELFDDICLTCPGVTTETLAVSAHFHGVNVDKLLERLNSP